MLTPDASQWLRDSSGVPWPDLSAVGTFDEVPAAFEAFERDAPDGWHHAAAEVEQWVHEIDQMLAADERLADPAKVVLLAARLSAELGALAVMLCESAPENDRSLLTGIAASVAQAGAEGFSAASAAWDVLRTASPVSDDSGAQAPSVTS